MKRRSGLVAVGLTVAAWAGVAGLLGGRAAALAAALAAVIVVVFFGSTKVVLGPIAQYLPGASLAAALLFYGTKVLALGVVVLVLLDPQGPGRHLDDRWFTATLIGGSLFAVTWLVVSDLRARHVIYDLDDRGRHDA
ncbi:hypothetical protein GL325_10085 [Aeromicrobium sp. 636]|uniref:Uncharacterized protein n=1 Tax=Aeromicrobium senzhongii TaxID=2663859 RepID=A0A8I0K1A0_9ACTN|nr:MULTISPECIES: hypothetical protein [Aeromicrobium]MBC9226673.1 hypothetical protein [Aeromicrobium senzhongii]MCQ3998774.1 hypothetical protein [Aeromicrobium sp. 636]